MKLEFRRQFILPISINLLIMTISFVLYYQSKSKLSELEYAYSVQDEGFRKIDDEFSDSLSGVRSYLNNKIDGKYLDGIKNDSLWIYLTKQRSLGKYYVDYQDGTKQELYAIIKGIEAEQENSMISFWLMISLALINLTFIIMGRISRNA